jgi:hypothetical protein
VIELFGILLVVQGAGGLINRVTGASSPSWFIQLHVFPPGLQIAASVVILLAGVAVLFVRQAGRDRTK